MIHTPEQSKAFLTLINSLSSIKFTDCSYGNDCTDSIYNDEYKMQIFLPNVENPFDVYSSDENFAHFSISYSERETEASSDNYIAHEFDIISLLFVLRNIQNIIEVDGEGMTIGHLFSETAPLEEWKETLLPILMLGVDDEITVGANITIKRFAQ